MAIGAAVGIGAGMAAAGAGVAGAGIGIKGQSPKKGAYQYGGSADARQGYLDQFGGQMQVGRTMFDQGAAQLGNALAQNRDNQRNIIGLGQQLGQMQAYSGDGGMQYLQGYDPGAVVQAQTRAALAQSARANLGAARGVGGALAMRNAMNANAEAGVQAAIGSGAAMGDARNQQALMQQQAAVQASQLGLQAGGMNMQNQLQAAQMQQQAMQYGQAFGADVASQYQQLGMQREMGYLGAQQDIETQQLQAQMAYDQMRQQARMRKSDRLLALGGSLISGGAGMMAQGFGGGR